MKKILFAIIGISIAILSCNVEGFDGYVLKGTLQNASSGPLYLEKMTLTKVTVIDTAQVADDGSFEMRGKMDEKGLYRIRYQPKVFWMVIGENDQLELKLDAKNATEYSISGDKENVQLVKLISLINKEQIEVNRLNQQFFQLTQSGASPAQLENIKKQTSVKYNALQEYLKQYADTTSNIHLAAYCASSIPMESYIPFFKKLIVRLDKEIPMADITAEYKARFKQTKQKVQQQQAQQVQEAKTGVGAVAKDIDLPSPNGKNIKLSSLKGNYVLLDFWASWCKPCRRENPNVVKMYDKYKNKGFTVYSVSLDKDRKRWVDAIKKDNLKWDNHVSDLKGWNSSAAKLYSVSSIPRAFLLDKEGNIIGKNLRGEALESKLAELFES